MFSKSSRLIKALPIGTAMLVGATSAWGQDVRPFELPPIHYSHTEPRDEVSRLLQRMAAGKVTLSGSDKEILRTVLRELNVPMESQLIVFSQTSLQAGLIRPANPRALYFSDTVYVGFVPGGVIEVAAIDPELGPVFYSIDPRNARAARRTFVRETSCLRCHAAMGDRDTIGPNAGKVARDIPGLFARSVVTTDDGEPLVRGGSELVDERTPFERRWGGWHVTGYVGNTNHRGNAFGADGEGEIVFTPSDDRPMGLSAFFDTSRYLAATSDVVALLVFEHQLAMHNSLTRAAHESRRALAGAAASAESRTAAEHLIAQAAEDVLDHLLFRDAAPLPPGVEGSDSFRRVFANGAPSSRDGHSLKDLSLHGRLFANRCSFLIYSDSFRALPAPLRDRILVRLGAALREEAADERYAYLERDEKRHIREVLRETLPEARDRIAGN